LDILKAKDVVVPDPVPKDVPLRIMANGLKRSEVLTQSGKAATTLGMVMLAETGRGYYGEFGRAFYVTTNGRSCSSEGCVQQARILRHGN